MEAGVLGRLSVNLPFAFQRGAVITLLANASPGFAPFPLVGQIARDHPVITL
jgi:hypothetical protein